MSRSLAGAVLGAALALSACLHPPHSVEGLSCRSDEECGPGSSCRAGACRARANLLSNGDFEGGLTGWAPFADTGLGRVEEGRAGGFAMRAAVAEGATAEFFGVSSAPGELAVSASGAEYCAEVWIRRETVRATFRLVMRRYGADGAYEDQRADSVLPADDEWLALRSPFQAPAPFDHQMRLRIYSDFAAGAHFLIDDARVWEAGPGECR